MGHQNNIISIRNITYASALQNHGKNVLISSRGTRGAKMDRTQALPLRSWEIREGSGVRGRQESVQADLGVSAETGQSLQGTGVYMEEDGEGNPGRVKNLEA